MTRYRRSWVVLALVSLAALAVSVPLLQGLVGTVNETTWRPATCLPDACFAEQVRSVGVRQPANTWSSLGFVAAAVGLAAWMAARRENSDWFPRLVTTLVVVSALVVGLGSAFYHATLTFVGQSLDVLGMTMFGLVMVLFAGTRLWGLPARATTSLLYAGSLTVATATFVSLPGTRRWLFAVLILTGLAIEARRARRSTPEHRRRWRYLLAALAVMVGGFLAWLLDMAGVGPTTGPLQGHVVWHGAGAVSLVLYAVYVHDDIGHDGAVPGHQAMAATR